MKIADLDTEQRVIVIAEAGNNHEGDLVRAMEMVQAAAEAGADVIKFQTFNTEHYVSRHDVDRFNRLKGFELKPDDFAALALEAAKAGIVFMSTPFDIGSVQVLESLVPAYKVSSADNTFFPLLESVARRGKPVLLSTGLADISEIRRAKETIQKIWDSCGIGDQGICLMHCVSSYPADLQELNLRVIPALRDTFQCEVGYSDHSLGLEAVLLAVALGARVIEKHFTLDKNLSDFRDHKLSADVGEMRDLVRSIHDASTALGTSFKEPQVSEKKVLLLVRRYVAVNRDMLAGDILTWQDLTWIRGSGRINAGRELEVLGKTLIKSVSKGDFLSSEHWGG